MKKFAIAVVVLVIFTSCIVSNSRITSNVDLKGGGVSISKDTLTTKINKE